MSQLSTSCSLCDFRMKSSFVFIFGFSYLHAKFHSIRKRKRTHLLTYIHIPNFCIFHSNRTYSVDNITYGKKLRQIYKSPNNMRQINNNKLELWRVNLFSLWRINKNPVIIPTKKNDKFFYYKVTLTHRFQQRSNTNKTN